ncbi:MAG TPA: amidohydrolase [Desulfurococcaceae archaeon]|nr:amidohydrolase [Desulfurococcaceae archaeon]
MGSKEIILKNLDRVYVLSNNIDYIDNATIVIRNGKIKEIVKGGMGSINPSAEVIDSRGLIAMPGLVDGCTHMGLYPLEGEYGEHGIEKSDPFTPHLRVIDAVDPYDKAFSEALAHGITTVAIHPGSYMSFGMIVDAITISPGLVAIMKTSGRILVEDHGVVFAIGDHVRRYMEQNKMVPTTRMGMLSIIRANFEASKDYIKKRESGEKIPTDLKMEVLAELLKNKLVAYVHAFTARDIINLVNLLKSYGINRIVVVHGFEAYKIADFLVNSKIPVILGPILFSRRGVELRELSPRSPKILSEKGVLFSLTTDHPTIPIEYLTFLSGLAVSEGLDDIEALKAITINTAKILGLDSYIGSIEPSKDADIAVFDSEPLDPKSRVVHTLIDGKLVYSR